MNRFYLLLLLMLLLLSGGIIALSYQPFFTHLVNFSWASLAFFTAISILIYEATKIALRDANPQAFLRAFYLGFMFKFFGSVLFMSYFIFIQPIHDKKFILPFFIQYFLFTLLLTYETISAKRKAG